MFGNKQSSVLRISTVLLLVGISLSCSEEQFAERDKDGKPITYSFDLRNQSQFVLEYAFVHQSYQDFRATPSILEEPLVQGSVKIIQSSQTSTRLTVVRLNRNGGTLRAYTTAFDIPLKDTSAIDYLDDTFRRIQRLSSE